MTAVVHQKKMSQKNERTYLFFNKNRGKTKAINAYVKKTWGRIIWNASKVV